MDYTTVRETHTWPRKTTVCCWNDGEPFAGVPVPLPFAHDEVLGTFEVSGVFCSVACAKRYSRDTQGYRIGLQMIWLSSICDIIFGDSSLSAVPPAPPRNTLVKYGGHIQLDEYRGGALDGCVELLSRPLVSFPIVAHIKPTQGQLGQVTGLRRPVVVDTEPIPVEARGCGLLDMPVNPQSVTSTTDHDPLTDPVADPVEPTTVDPGEVCPIDADHGAEQKDTCAGSIKNKETKHPIRRRRPKARKGGGLAAFLKPVQ